ncbi:MAG: hypothetical protein WAN00_23845, partial [Trebonia sp.]
MEDNPSPGADEFPPYPRCPECLNPEFGHSGRIATHGERHTSLGSHRPFWERDFYPERMAGFSIPYRDR